MATLRTRCLSTKITESEYQTFQGLANDRTVSEWARDVLQHHATHHQFEEILIADLVALRTILVNVLIGVCSGAPATLEEMRHIIARADEDRFRKAQERLSDSAKARRW